MGDSVVPIVVPTVVGGVLLVLLVVLLVCCVWIVPSWKQRMVQRSQQRDQLHLQQDATELGLPPGETTTAPRDRTLTPDDVDTTTALMTSTKADEQMTSSEAPSPQAMHTRTHYSASADQSHSYLAPPYPKTPTNTPVCTSGFEVGMPTGMGFELFSRPLPRSNVLRHPIISEVPSGESTQTVKETADITVE